MSTSSILIVYGTRYGQTAKITRRIADLLMARGHAVTLVNGDELRSDLTPRTFSGVIIGASVIRGRHQRSIRSFVRAHRDALNAMPSAFFSVSGSAASSDEQGRAEARRCLDAFLTETGWRPPITETVAGAMAFTKYGPVLRWIMKQISKKSGGPTDTTRDHELTNWAQVERLVEAFSAMSSKRDDALVGAACE